ncbi:endonuclease/exonuclease/phosphatase family domain-containing protein 1-like isoform X2 [Scylla paramamosain]|uniref:endonuclease/exonuclease/phosphatase family domain-containing protein 1-like isoform X2 n=1 Tax=Scylla paramamosain TaxID=85552 RepID=UPI003083D799
MGQCTSGELPPHTSDGTDLNATLQVPENGTDVSPQESPIKRATGHKFSRRSSWSNKFKKNKSKDLSATFNLYDYDYKKNLLNINTAAEEELMILPGVTRSVARNIVEYRTAIGGFRRVEDLALVSGVGATRLQSFKSDITVKRMSSSRSSSRTQSIDSLPSYGSGRSQRSQQSQGGRSVHGSPIRAINVNAASIFDLMNIRGMNQELAANIVEYRERKGPFKNIDDLIKVKGISGRVLSILRMYLTVSSVSPASPQVSDVISVASCSKMSSRNLNGRMAGHRRTYSAPLNNNGEDIEQPSLDLKGISLRNPVDFSTDIYELLSLRSERPVVKEVFTGNYQGQPAIRVATWNLQQLTKEKICNLGVLEVVCRTILENGFSFIAIQEVGSKDVLEKICCELNHSSLRRVREWTGAKGEWRWQVSEEPVGDMAEGAEYAAFIYNVQHGLQLLSASLLSIHENNGSAFSTKPYLGYFKVNDFEFVVINLHINGSKLAQSSGTSNLTDSGEDKEGSPSHKVSQLAPLVAALRDKLVTERNIILLGDFSMSPEDIAFNILRETSYTNIVPADTMTGTTKETVYYDNIWLNPCITTLYTGHWGIVNEGLSHLAIPSGWGWGGAVSEHCPLYCDLFCHGTHTLHQREARVLWY